MNQSGCSVNSQVRWPNLVDHYKAYEIGQQTARAEVMEKVLKVNQFKKYTMWLLHDELLPEYGQISPNLLDVKAEKFKKVGRLSRKKEEVVNQIPSKKPNMQAIINSMSTLNDNELKQLAIILSRRGSLFLLELLDQKNRDLLDLTGIKKIAAWQLKDMDDERVREILSEMDKANLESKTVEEMNMSHKKRSVN